MSIFIEVGNDDEDDEEDYEDYETDEDDDEDEDEDDDDDDEDDDDEDEDLYGTLEYLDTCQILTRKEIIDDISTYLRRFQPKYKIIKRKDE